jgi:hypothetical protein
MMQSLEGLKDKIRKAAECSKRLEARLVALERKCFIAQGFGGADIPCAPPPGLEISNTPAACCVVIFSWRPCALYP